MRIVFIHPNYHSGGDEIAGNWPPAWVAYLPGSLKRAGFDDIHFADAMTYHLGPDVLRAKLADLQPDIVGVTAITPSIYEAEEVLRIAGEVVPNALRVLGGGVHATFMYRQVLSEAPWMDVIVRGEGEFDLCRSVLAEAGVMRPPRDAGMLPEADCAAVHQALRRVSSGAEGVLEEAGLATGDYILAHRIPKLAQRVLLVLPGGWRHRS